MLKSKLIVLSISFLFLISLVSAATSNPFNYESEDVFNYPEETLDGHLASFFMPLNQSVFGNFSFNGGWLNDGLSIIDGDLYACSNTFCF